MAQFIKEVAVALPHNALPDADWADAYRITLDAPLANARAAFSQCARTRNLQRAKTYSLNLKDTAVWTGGSRPQNFNGVTQ